jgi:YidC/Oxa1 family membrane protein insertase
VLLYWLTTNLWTMGQQFYVIRRNPAPGSPAFDALEKRKAEKAARVKHEATAAAAAESLGTSTAVDESGEPGTEATGTEATGTEGPQRTPRQRQQPRRQPKRKR